MLTFLPKTFHPVTDLSFYDWVENGCAGSLEAMSRYVPPVFESYVHICHPVWKLPESIDESENKKFTELEQANKMMPIPWSEAIKDRIPHFDGLGSWSEVGKIVDYNNIKPGTTTKPLEGVPTVEALDAVEKTIQATTQPEELCICGFWEGFGDSSDELKQFTRAKTTRMAQQKHYLVQGPQCELFDYWRALLNSPCYWAPVEAPQAVWPPSRQWFYAIPFHRHSAIFGGTKQMAEMLLKSNIEAYELPPGHVFKF